MKISNGFYTALGTPQDATGNFLVSSFYRQVEDQVAYGASGLLVMGSMGLGVFVRSSDYVHVASTAVEASRGACPVFIGVTDTSAVRSLDRVNALKCLNIDGIVATVPYYYTVSQKEIINFYTYLAKQSPFPVYMYDLPTVSKSKIDYNTVMQLQNVENILGIKSADYDMGIKLQEDSRHGRLKSSFNFFYSGLDTFDEAYANGICMNLDGMFSCTGPLTKEMYNALATGDALVAKDRLNKILTLRNLFISNGVYTSFTHVMNLLGYEGNFHPDYISTPSNRQLELLQSCMKELDLLKIG